MRDPRIAFDRRRSSWAILALALLAGLLLSVGPVGAAIDRGLMVPRFAVVDRAASGRVAIVEMDAASAARIRRWPWSRAHYAAVVDRLRLAGAASIVFDVDFSSAADAAGDAAFARALARADGLVALPTFGQGAGSADARTIDALPIAMLRDHVALASVSIAPDPDGQVRTMPFGTVTAGVARPSLSAFIAGTPGIADSGFPIDMAIDPATIPRLSFVAVRDGHFDPASVRGRDILIGATAVEMGDRYGTPGWGVIPGVVVQALATETLFRGVPVEGSAFPILLFCTVAVAWLVSRRRDVAIALAATISIAVLIVSVVFAQHALARFYPLAGGLAMLAVAAAACSVREVLARFAHQRAVDAATGLPNAHALTGRTGGDGATVLAAATIDNYDALCAVLGHRASADVLVRVGERLALIAVGGTVYRTAEHQLAVLLSPDSPAGDSLDGLRALLLQPVEVGGRRVDVQVSVGVAAGDRAAIETLLTDATLAADTARTSDRFWAHAATDLVGLERSISLMGELDDALVRGQIEVFYQPKYHLRERRITSVEALVRWRHPVRGFVGPDLFIPAAEATNRIAPLTLHVLAQVVRDLARWRIAHPDMTAAVNISAKLLSSVEFNAAVEACIATAAVPASALVFEVTESAAMSDVATAIAALCHYRDLGIAVSMDDYGTGRSTLTYLRQLPLAELKIDRSFVQFAHRNHDDALLVRSTIDLAHRMGLKVVAEGVEDAACMDFLASCDCDLVQGYLVSRPLPALDFERLIATRYRYAA